MFVMLVLDLLLNLKLFQSFFAACIIALQVHNCAQLLHVLCLPKSLLKWGKLNKQSLNDDFLMIVLLFHNVNDIPRIIFMTVFSLPICQLYPPVSQNQISMTSSLHSAI